MTGMSCRLLPMQQAAGAWQMAADEVLLEQAMRGRAGLRFYTWAEPTLSLGYFQQAAPARAHRRLGELPCVRRASGGAALVHHHEVTYALALPADEAWQRRGESWLARMHAVIRDALASPDIPLSLCQAEVVLGEVLCFLHHTPNDLLLGDAKVVGSAQRKRRGALLQHGGILLRRSPFAPELPGINDLTGQTLGPEQVAHLVAEHFSRAAGASLEPCGWTSDEVAAIERLAHGRYQDPAWTLRR